MTTPKVKWYRDDEPIPIGPNARWALEAAEFRRGVVDAACDNVIASRIGEACNEAQGVYAGDTIDRGLALVRILRERGFAVVELPK